MKNSTALISIILACLSSEATAIIPGDNTACYPLSYDRAAIEKQIKVDLLTTYAASNTISGEEKLLNDTYSAELENIKVVSTEFQNFKFSYSERDGQLCGSIVKKH
ncbi:hypothetical protein J8L73_18780 [Pseudoalteromonas sp. MMG006]|uniref:hypothetical protein n=1 Tax=Pseudoalteromonas sp. MMG006 TaxID=2822683 RepID=UPI001B370980|nr:hypothetical protein [Pseudoalteromonas sp. MMG006]MBQ4801139.1 hypothetical protein [Pseudoalteromonas sp. MMG006]